MQVHLLAGYPCPSLPSSDINGHMCGWMTRLKTGLGGNLLREEQDTRQKTEDIDIEADICA